MEKLIQSAKKRLGADCGSDHELLIAKFRLKLRKATPHLRPEAASGKTYPTAARRSNPTSKEQWLCRCKRA